jgi:hypothetical protein
LVPQAAGKRIVPDESNIIIVQNNTLTPAVRHTPPFNLELILNSHKSYTRVKLCAEVLQMKIIDILSVLHVSAEPEQAEANTRSNPSL